MNFHHTNGHTGETDGPWTAAAKRLRTAGRAISLADDKLMALHDLVDAFAMNVREGFLSHPEVSDRLNGIADAYGLYAEHGIDEVQRLIADGLDRATEPQPEPERKGTTASKQKCAPTHGGLDVLCLADVKPKAIDWLWENRIAIGKVTVLAGDGGLGKSTILCDLAARTTTGEKWPDGSNGGEPGSVIILSAEDDVEDTLVPRLLAAGADMNRVFNIRAVRDVNAARRTFSLQTDLAKLEAEISKRSGTTLVIIDPVTSYLGKVDSHKNAEVRTVLEPLGDMASRLRVAVICNNHFNKAGGNANSRIIGSVAFVNQARAAFIVTTDEKDETRRLLIPSKMNIAPIKHGLAYRIEGCLVTFEGKEIPTSRIMFESAPVTITADQALAAAAGNDEARTARDEAEEFLKDILEDGPLPQREVKDAAEGAGLAWATVRRAKDRLKVVAVRETEPGSGRGTGRWLWSLEPVQGAQNLQGAHVGKVSTLNENEHLEARRCSSPPDLLNPMTPEPDPLDIPDYLRRN